MLKLNNMKNILIVAGVLVLLALVAWFFWPEAAADDANMTAVEKAEMIEGDDTEMERRESVMVMETGTYSANTSDSTIEWSAGKPAIAGYVHHGTFAIDSGSINLSAAEITGEFVIDVESLKVTSLGGGKVGQESTLEGHLKSDRFLDTETHSTATFVITDVSPKVLPGPDAQDYTATGELTLKGIAKEVTFPMKVVVVSESEVWVEADIELNRTEWGINSGSATIAEEITDNIIGDTVNLNLSLKLTK